MAKPQMKSYNAADEEVKAQAVKVVPREVDQPRILADPLTSFETYHFDIQTTLRTWMTCAKEQRIENAKRYAMPPRENADNDPKLIDWRKRHKILNFIMWIESIHPRGEREVAAVAFNGLFGGPEKKEKA